MTVNGLELNESNSASATLLPFFEPPALTLEVSREWGGRPLERPWAQVGLSLTPTHLTLQLSALWTQAPPPGPPPGPLWALWEREVIECFIVGEAGHYLELELGPYGHHLAIYLSGVRSPERWCLPVDLRCERAPEAKALGRWRAEARVSRALLPPPISSETATTDHYRINAFACHQLKGHPRYLLASPLEGARPDFHQPTRFPVARLDQLERAERSEI